MLKLYSFFHLNLAFSSVEEDRRKAVIDKCYWPLLRLIRKLGWPVGIELSAYSLLVIEELSPNWVSELRELIDLNLVEFIESGYAQIIGPLVPSRVSEENLKGGRKIYLKLLGRNSKLALINEQAFSRGVVSIYKSMGYEAIIMEWDNPYKANPHWDPSARYFPQTVLGNDGETIGLVWNKSIAFQKFQRYAHGDIDIDEIMDYVAGHVTSNERALPLYGNDAEVFDFRPGRFSSESFLEEGVEWERISDLITKIGSDSRFEFILPSDVLALCRCDKPVSPLDLSSPSQPIPVKKQEKYNAARWALTGRDDLRINTRCWRIFDRMSYSSSTTSDDWIELCFLWSSDFRTHITMRRWEDYLNRLARFEKKWSEDPLRLGHRDAPAVRPLRVLKEGQGSGGVVTPVGIYTVVQCGSMLVKFNNRKGLTIDSFTDSTIFNKPLFGTLKHGHFDDIKYGADYFSGHLTFESPGMAKVTDLWPTAPEIFIENDTVRVAANIPTHLGNIYKQWDISGSDRTAMLTYRLDWCQDLVGSLRLGYITLLSNSFERASLCYRTHNGGKQQECFALHSEFDHGRPVSFLVSCNQVLGMTTGILEIRDRHVGVEISCNKAESALLGMVSNVLVGANWLTRGWLSAMELDETSKPRSLSGMTFTVKYRLTAGFDSNH